MGFESQPGQPEVQLAWPAGRMLAAVQKTAEDTVMGLTCHPGRPEVQLACREDKTQGAVLLEEAHPHKTGARLPSEPPAISQVDRPVLDHT